MTGKEKCRVLREIRNDIAAKNGLKPFEDTCTHTGECKGTCPKCESEVRLLEKALADKRARRKRVALAGVSIGLCVSLTGCQAVDTLVSVVEDILPGFNSELSGAVSNIEVLAGEVDESGYVDTTDAGQFVLPIDEGDLREPESAAPEGEK